jgi:tRNA pseudouridine38-40 synthase
LVRFQLTLEYDGGPFWGWQRVGEDRMTVQRALEEALERIFGEIVPVTGAGRTDAGVHASGQRAHFDAPRPITAFRLSEALNAQLRPHPIAVIACAEVPESFHARFSAIQRVYRYTIVNRRADLTLERGRAWRVGRKLDSDAMHAAAQRLLGRHDFSTFRDAQCQASSPIRTLDQCDVRREGDHLFVTVAARSFLHRQVRSMVGSLVEVGCGKWSADELTRRLDACDRARCGQVAPAAGLCLIEVRYDAPAAGNAEQKGGL